MATQLLPQGPTRTRVRSVYLFSKAAVDPGPVVEGIRAMAEVGCNATDFLQLPGERGGVGAYPRAGFLHLDVGPARTW